MRITFVSILPIVALGSFLTGCWGGDTAGLEDVVPAIDTAEESPDEVGLAADGLTPLDAPDAIEGVEATSTEASEAGGPDQPPDDADASPVELWDAGQDSDGCPPQCSGKVCGDDGCGGNCGTCGSGQECQAGKCALTACPTGFVMVQPGTFTMGTPTTDPASEAYGTDQPEHQVTITSSYCMKATEVTQGEWQAVMGKNPSYYSSCGAACPVDQVSWWDSVAYCNALSVKEGLAPCYTLTGCTGTAGGGCPPGTKGTCTGDFVCTGVSLAGLSCPGYRLPTEAEWEFAARAGTTTSTYNGTVDTGHLTCSEPNTVLDPIAWFCGNSKATYPGADDCSSWGSPLGTCGPQSVKGKQANLWGLYDMLGNVWEWVWDTYGYYPTGPVTDPGGLTKGTLRVSRGGAWSGPAGVARAAFRTSAFGPSDRISVEGLRPARSTCVPSCGGRKCGDDGCGGTCGACGPGTRCASGQCVDGACPAGYQFVPPGSFTMGAPTDEPGGGTDNQRQVTISKGFCLKTTEVTQEEWEDVMGNNPSYYSSCGATCPVERTSWWDAAAYCNALSAKEGLQPCYALTGCSGTPGGGCTGNFAFSCWGDYGCTGVTFAGLSCNGYRLPTEAEWEYAARAGTTTGTYNGTCDPSHLKCEEPNSVLDPIAWYCGNAGKTPAAVKGKQANAWGLYDMLGNVYEWCWDRLGTEPTQATLDPTGPDSGSTRLLRGGSWRWYASFARAAVFASDDPWARADDHGLRPARSSP